MKRKTFLKRIENSLLNFKVIGCMDVDQFFIYVDEEPIFVGESIDKTKTMNFDEVEDHVLETYDYLFKPRYSLKAVQSETQSLNRSFRTPVQIDISFITTDEIDCTYEETKTMQWLEATHEPMYKELKDVQFTFAYFYQNWAHFKSDNGAFIEVQIEEGKGFSSTTYLREWEFETQVKIILNKLTIIVL